MSLRVVHCGTGVTGRHGLRAIVDHPDLDLVGVFAHSPQKIGRDAAQLCGAPELPPIGASGVLATGSWEALLALEPDCLCYCANGTGREDDACREMARFLDRGIDVVTTSVLEFVHPAAADPRRRDVIEAACRRGGASFFNTGIDPGYATSGLALSLLSLAGRIDSVRVQELGNISHYGVEPVMREYFGFGKPLDYAAPLRVSGVIELWWKGTLLTIAEAIGASIERHELNFEVAEFDRDIDTAFGIVPAGSIAAVRFELIGIVDGRPLIVLEHVDRAHPDVAPQWDAPTGTRDSSYRVIVRGHPGYRCEVVFDYRDRVDAGVVVTATHAVNAIPAVCAAPPGILSPLDLPVFTGRISPRTAVQSSNR
ncbi:MAG: dihydrodipicolinate reductase [Gammaproteobacteria bacterium]